MRRPAGFDFSRAHEWASNTGYPSLFDPDALLGEPQTVYCLDMATAGAAAFSFDASLEIRRPGLLHGIGGWFLAQLSPGVTLTNAPTANRRLKRRNAFLPIPEAVAVQPGDVVNAHVHVIPPDTVTWTVEACRAGQSLGRFRRSTSNGMLVQREELRRMDPRHVPTLTPRGVARMTVLRLCDGQTPLARIEHEVFRRHPELFDSVGDAAAFVAEVVTRYSR